MSKTVTRPITKFDFKSLATKRFQCELEGAIKEVCEKFGLSYAPGSVTYSDTSYKTRLQITTTETEEGKPFNAGAAEFEKHCVWHGIPRDWLNKTFTVRHKKYKIVGWNNRKRKNKVILEDMTGETFIAPVVFVKAGMENE